MSCCVLQEAQRKKKAERQIASSKAGQTAREEKDLAAKAGGHKGEGTGGGGAGATGGGGAGGEEKHQHQTISSQLSKTSTAKIHTSSKPPVSKC